MQVKTFLCYSLAVDVRIVIQDNGKLLVFVREVDENFRITEDLLSVESLKNTTSHDLYESVVNAIDKICIIMA